MNILLTPARIGEVEIKNRKSGERQEISARSSCA